MPEIIISCIAPDNREYPHNFSYFSIKTCCGYSLEVPQGGTSSEYPQYMFLLRNKKNISSFGTEFLDFSIDY